MKKNKSNGKYKENRRSNQFSLLRFYIFWLFIVFHVFPHVMERYVPHAIL